MLDEKLKFFKSEIEKFVANGGKLTTGSLYDKGCYDPLGVLLYNRSRLPVKNFNEEYEWLYKEFDLNDDFYRGFDGITMGINKNSENYKLGLSVRKFCLNKKYLFFNA